jgi:hypothetical protein
MGLRRQPKFIQRNPTAQLCILKKNLNHETGHDNHLNALGNRIYLLGEAHDYMAGSPEILRDRLSDH